MYMHVCMYVCITNSVHSGFKFIAFVMVDPRHGLGMGRVRVGRPLAWLRHGSDRDGRPSAWLRQGSGSGAAHDRVH
jgi:hypothetical protein